MSLIVSTEDSLVPMQNSLRNSPCLIMRFRPFMLLALSRKPKSKGRRDGSFKRQKLNCWGWVGYHDEDSYKPLLSFPLQKVNVEKE